jgi:predicted glycosyltransferase
VVETLASADRAVLVPFGSARETEQGDRAAWLAERGLVTCVPADGLSADSLAAAVERALQGPSIRSFPPCDLNGAANTAAVLRQRLS